MESNLKNSSRFNDFNSEFKGGTPSDSVSNEIFSLRQRSRKYAFFSIDNKIDLDASAESVPVCFFNCFINNV